MNIRGVIQTGPRTAKSDSMNTKQFFSIFEKVTLLLKCGVDSAGAVRSASHLLCAVNRLTSEILVKLFRCTGNS